MKLRYAILTAAASVALLAGCGSAATTGDAPAATGNAATAPPDTAAPAATSTTYPAACTAAKLAASGEWEQSETHWLTAESAASNAGDMTATTAYFTLVEDTASVAVDKATGSSSTKADIATYNSDLTAAAVSC